MEKKNLIKSIWVLMLIGCAFCISLGFKQETEEQFFTIKIPRRLGLPTYKIILGQQDEVTVGQFKEVSALISQQLWQQDKKFAILDSINLKKDSTNLHKKKP